MYLRTRTTGHRRRGVTLILTCVCLTAVLFMTALAIDCGNMMSQRRQAQNCADAAALAGCLKLSALDAAGTTPTAQNIKDAVNNSLTNNGYTDGTNCTVTVNWPPTSGSHMDTYSVEVLITFTYNNLVVNGSDPVNVRAVATCNPSSAPLVASIITEPSAAKAFWVNSGTFTLNNSFVQVNSTSSTAAVVDGSSKSAADATVRVDGGSSGSFSPAASTGYAPKADPYAALPVPSTSGMTQYTTSQYSPNLSGNITLNPGYYPNGLYCINGGNVTLNAGLYVISNGNFWINTTGTVTGNGVTIYHTGANSTALLNVDYGLDCGIVLCPTNNNYTFTAPTSGTYAGISFVQGPNCTSEAFYDFWGSGQLNVGIQYFPNSTLRCWSVTNGVINCNQLVAKDFKVTGSHEIYGTSQNGGFSPITWNASKASHAPPTTVALVE